MGDRRFDKQLVGGLEFIRKWRFAVSGSQYQSRMVGQVSVAGKLMQLRDGQLAVFEYLQNVRMECGIKK
jgi:hypothetical protein